MGKKSAETLATFQQLWKERVKTQRPCAVCGTKNWRLNNNFVLIPTSDAGKAQRGSKVFPMMALSCGNCGNTHFLNLLTLGLTAAQIDALEFDGDAE